MSILNLELLLYNSNTQKNLYSSTLTSLIIINQHKLVGGFNPSEKH